MLRELTPDLGNGSPGVHQAEPSDPQRGVLGTTMTADLSRDLCAGLQQYLVTAFDHTFRDVNHCQSQDGDAAQYPQCPRIYSSPIYQTQRITILNAYQAT